MEERASIYFEDNTLCQDFLMTRAAKIRPSRRRYGSCAERPFAIGTSSVGSQRRPRKAKTN
jgi:hypothetical protein